MADLVQRNYSSYCPKKENKHLLLGTVAHVRSSSHQKREAGKSKVLGLGQQSEKALFWRVTQ